MLFRLSNMKNPRVFYPWTRKTNIDRPVMGPNHSFLGFVKHTLRDSSEGWDYINKHMLSSSSLRKNKEVLARNGGGKIWERDMFVFVLIGSKCRSWTWHPLFIIWIRFGKSICLSFMIWLQDSFHVVIFESMLAKIIGRVVHMFKRSVHLKALYWVGHLQLSFPFVGLPCVQIPNSHATVSTFKLCYFISCHWWGIHQGPPVTSLFLSTSAHYPGIKN